MKKDDGFTYMMHLQEMYDQCKNLPSEMSSCHESMIYAFIGASVAFSEWKIGKYELDIWLDANNITIANDIDFIENIAYDAIDMMPKRYAEHLTTECINIDYIMPMKRLLKIIEEHNR